MARAHPTLSGAAIMLAGQWLKFTLQILSTSILARLLAPSEFGLVAIVTATIGIASILADFGLSLASLRDPKMSNQDRSNLLWANIIVGFLASTLVVLAAQPISAFYEKPELELIIYALSGVFMIQAATSQFRAELARSAKYARITTVEVCAQFIATVVAIIAASNGASYWSLVVQQIALVLIQFIGLALISGWTPSPPRRMSRTTKHYIFGSKASATQIINYISGNIDTVALGKHWDNATVGIYNQAFLFFKMPIQQLAAPLTQVMVPFLAKLEEASLAHQVKQIQRVLIYILVGAFAGMASAATPVVIILLGEEWLSVAPILKILAVGGAFQAMGYLYYWVFIVRNCTGRQLVYGGFARAAMVLLIVLVAPAGASGTAWAVSFGLILNWLLLTIFVVPHTGIKRSIFVVSCIRPLATISAGFIVATVGDILVFQALDVWAQLFCIAVTWFAYMTIVALVTPAFRRDIIRIMQLMKLKKSPSSTMN